MSKQYDTWQEAFIDVNARARSNTYQIGEIKASLRDINTKLDATSAAAAKIQAVVVDDGLVSTIKRQAKDIEGIRADFADYQINRLVTCPVASTTREHRNWTATVIKLIIAVIGLSSTGIVVFQFITNML